MRAAQISLIISTYERPGPLDQVLQGLQRQSEMPGEIIIADDGSGPATRELIGQWQKRLAAPLRHLWQPNLGFRKTLILNQSVAAAKGDYIVLLDGDCVPHAEIHRRSRRPGGKEFLGAGPALFCGGKIRPGIFRRAPRPFADGCSPGASPAWPRPFAFPFRSCAATPASAASSAATWDSGARTFSPSTVSTRNTPGGALARTPTWARGFIIWAGRANLFMAMPLFII